MRFRLFAAALIAAAFSPAAAGAFVTPELTVLSSPQPGVLHAEWVNPDDAAGYAYNAVRCEDLAQPVVDLGRWSRWPGNYTAGSADRTVTAGHSYRCYVTEIDVTGRVGGRSDLLDVTAAVPDPSPTPSETPTPEPTVTETPTPSPTATPTPPPDDGGRVVWGSDFERATGAAGPDNPTALQDGGRAVYSVIQHNYDSKVLCSIEVSTDRARTGARSMKLTIGAPLTDSGGSNDPGRCQPTANMAKATQGTDLFYGWSQYLDAGWSSGEVVNNRQFFLGMAGFRFTDTKENGPGANLGGDRGKYGAGINLAGTVGQVTAGRTDLGAMLFGGWDDFVVHVRWSTGFDGVMEWWRNGVKMGRYDGRTLGAGRAVQRRQGVYEGVNVSQTRVLYVDNDRAGTSYAAVDPSR